MFVIVNNRKFWFFPFIKSGQLFNLEKLDFVYDGSGWFSKNDISNREFPGAI